MGAHNKRNRKNKLWKKQNGLCFWCHQPMINHTEWRLGQKASIAAGNLPEKLPLMLATLEHLHDQYDPMRVTKEGKLNVALACWKCNNDRGLKSQRDARDKGRISHRVAIRALACINVLF